MTENNENVQPSGLDSKFMKVAMTIVSVLLMFGGASYVPYLLSDIIHVDYVASNVVGILLFVVGLGMIVFLIRKKVIE
jgi:flagellar basal body-associated protein FliL